jgi:hypothetical protein
MASLTSNFVHKSESVNLSLDGTKVYQYYYYPAQPTASLQVRFSRRYQKLERTMDGFLTQLEDRIFPMNSLILQVPHPILSHQPSHQNYIIAGLLELNLSLEIAQRVASFAVNLAYGCTGYSITAVVEFLWVEEVDERLLFESLHEEYLELLNGGIGDQNELSTEVGASTSAIENLVKKGGFVCNCKSQESADIGTCTICLEDFSSSEAEEDEKLIRMDCYHIFHQSCLLPWLQKQASCPNCRRELIEE